MAGTKLGAVAKTKKFHKTMRMHNLTSFLSSKAL
jgi:hypothetical protein